MQQEFVVVRVVKGDNQRDKAVEAAFEEMEESLGDASPAQNGQRDDVLLEEMTKERLIEKLAEAEAAAQKNYDLYLRSEADIDNLKKRYQKENQGLVKFANETLLKQLLPVADNLEKAIDHSQKETSTDAVKEGVELTLKGLLDVLQRAGVKAIDAVGQPFDPNFHEAVSEAVNERVEAGTVLNELQRGYTLHERLLRPSMVVISKKKA